MSSVAPTAQRVNLVQLQDGIPMYLWRRSISFLTIREQAVSVHSMSRFFRECSDAYMKNFWSEPNLRLPQDACSLARAMEMCQYLMEQEGYVEGTTVVVVLGSGVHEVIGSWKSPFSGRTYQQMLSVPCDNLSFVGKGEGETTVHGGLVAEDGRSLSIADLTVKNSCGPGLYAHEMGTKMNLHKVMIEECQYSGVNVGDGAEFVATDCQFRQNGGLGVLVSGSMTTARLTNCTFHHNKSNGVGANCGAVVDLMGEGTSINGNKEHGLCALSHGSTINVYQPCVLNDMSHGNKGQNIVMGRRGIVQQK